jgi:hypothetical protein
MEFNYRKSSLPSFVDETSAEIVGMTDLQTYIPIYDRFFKCNETNAKTLTLNNKLLLTKFVSRESHNVYQIQATETNGTIHDIKTFIKFAPLIDHVKYMTGKYVVDIPITVYPKFGDTKETFPGHKKVLDPNNVSYVDGFFAYLTSGLLHGHGFVHGLDYYGSFLGTKESLELDVQDDIEYLERSDYFHDHNGILFHLDEDMVCKGNDSRKNKPPVHAKGDIVGDACLGDILSKVDVEMSGITDQEETRGDRKYTFDLNDITVGDGEEHTAAFRLRDRSGSESSGTECSSDCSSDSSVTCDENVEGMDGSDEDDDGSCSESSFGSDYSDDHKVNCKIDNFPVQAIALEQCDGTLDSLFTRENLAMKRPQLRSAMFQIIMCLRALQKAFHFTHNDLHTNNVMWCATDRKYLFYKYNSKHYKVPTYGRIFKIIDFGRAIYRFRGETMCSDSYHPSGDAGSQYNCEPYFNPKKPRLEPHFGFDLARLGCSLYELVDAEDVDDNGIINEEKLGDVERMIVSWCRDDKGRNILFKRDGDERYPGFKLYKMIARTSHAHTPEKMLTGHVFDTYLIPMKKGKKQPGLMDVDAIPDYTEVSDASEMNSTVPA